MNVAIIFGDKGVIGGTHRVAACIIEALNGVNLIPDLYCFKSISLKEYEDKFNKKIDMNIKKMKNVKLKLPLYTTVFEYLRNRNLNFEEYDFVYDISGNPLLTPDKNAFHYIFGDYNYPFESDERKRALLHKIYVSPYKYFVLPHINRKLYSSNVKVFTLSKYVQETIKRESGTNVPILYPPADIENIFSSNPKRENEVSSISRFEEVKNQLEQILIAKELPMLHFNIIGAAKSIGMKYFNKCKKYILDNCINNVTLYPDLSFSKIKEILHSSKYYISTERRGHWSLTTVEGIVAGCIPVVFNGGCQKEIVPFERLRFNSQKEAVDIFKRLQKSNKINEYRKKLQEHIKKFSEYQFKEKILAQLSKLGGQ